jgi:hypothetical protein
VAALVCGACSTSDGGPEGSGGTGGGHAGAGGGAAGAGGGAAGAGGGAAGAGGGAAGSGGGAAGSSGGAAGKGGSAGGAAGSGGSAGGAAGGAGGGGACATAVENGACAQDGLVCGSCTSPCQFCNLLRCMGGHWQRQEAAPAPCFDCGSSLQCQVSAQYCHVTVGGPVGSDAYYECRAFPTSCGTRSCQCFSGSSTCVQSSSGDVTVTVYAP